MSVYNSCALIQIPGVSAAGREILNTLSLADIKNGGFADRTLRLRGRSWNELECGGTRNSRVESSIKPSIPRVQQSRPDTV